MPYQPYQVVTVICSTNRCIESMLHFAQRVNYEQVAARGLLLALLYVPCKLSCCIEFAER